MQRVILHKTGENLHRNVWTFEWTYRSNDLDIHSVTNSWADSKVVVTRTKKTLDQESPPPQLMTFMFRRSDAYKEENLQKKFNLILTGKSNDCSPPAFLLPRPGSHRFSFIIEIPAEGAPFQDFQKLPQLLCEMETLLEKVFEQRWWVLWRG